MATVTYSLRLTREGTIRVMVGRAREYIGLEGKTKDEIYEAVKWALVSKDAFVSADRLERDLFDLGFFGMSR